MSIRFRFTLLYTFILALTLTIFGLALYTIQSQDTLTSLKRDLSLGANKLADATLKTPGGQNFPEPPPDNGHTPPVPFNQFSSDQTFQAFPEREIARVLDPQGNLVASPFGREGDALPLSEEGLQALQSQQDWWETDTVSGEKMLIYSRPVIVDNEVEYIVQVARPLTERDRTLQSLATTLLIAGLLTVLVAFGIGWVFSGFTFSPIHRITQTAQTIGDERDFTRRVNYTGPQDEVGQLANTFNSMLSRLQDAFQKVEHSLEMQRNFVADVSHELRTPLTTLRGNLGLMRRDLPLEEKVDIVNDMVDESDRLIRLVNELLLLARADTGRSLAKEPLDVSIVLEETSRQAHQLDSQRQINLDVPSDLTILGDRDAFKQVALILLDNALKHSTGDINVTARLQGAQVEIRVQDFGEGIPADKLERVFDRFYRGDDTSTIPGFGLGLPIAKTLIEAQDGEIILETEVGRGSTVILRFHAMSIMIH
ncbi:MAG: HAMP domain-containing histidine kinase [Chloroflexi bacterium]|nr:HAMP domain-containing histidine kinase [Chloroflexota bacterium]